MSFSRGARFAAALLMTCALVSGACSHQSDRAAISVPTEKGTLAPMAHW